MPSPGPALPNRSQRCEQDEARGVIAAPVERIADSLDEEDEEEMDEQSSDIASAVKGEFGTYKFQEAQLQVRFCHILQATSHGFMPAELLHACRDELVYSVALVD